MQSFAWSHDGTSMVFTGAEREPESAIFRSVRAGRSPLRLLAIRSRSVTTLVAGRRLLIRDLPTDRSRLSSANARRKLEDRRRPSTGVLRGHRTRLVCRYLKPHLVSRRRF